MAERSHSSPRKIIHVDMDAFFASVEQRDNPDLRGKPVVVGGRPDRRGAIAAASYEARQYGIHSAMPSRRAAQLCKDLIFVVPQMGKYKQISTQVRAIFDRYTRLVEPVAFDEAYLDVSHHHPEYTSATAIARAIKQDIYQETQLTASAGISVNKFLAKMASGLNKPDGLTVIRPEQAQAFVHSLPIEQFHGIGKVTARKMRSLNINTGADLCQWSEDALVNIFGKVGHYFYQIARGYDDRPVNPNRVRKSVGAERSFDPDIDDRTILLQRLHELGQTLEHRLQTAQTLGTGHTLILKLKYGNYQQRTRSKTIGEGYTSTSLIHTTAQELFETHWVPGNPVRLLGLSMSGFETTAAQLILPLQTESPKR